MSLLKWDQIGERTYHTGVDRVVLFPVKSGVYEAGVAWSGVTSIAESPSGGENTPIHADNMKYLNLVSAEDFGMTLGCYTSPDEWEECNGEASPAQGLRIAQQSRSSFGLVYRTLVGNDTDGTNHGYEIHFAYGCTSKPSERTLQTVNESPEASEYSYEIATTAVPVTGYKPTALAVIDSTKVSAEKLAAIEAIIYGKEAVGNEGDPEYQAAVPARLPMPDELIQLLSEN